MPDNTRQYFELGQSAFYQNKTMADCKFRNAEKKLYWMRGFKQAQQQVLPVLASGNACTKHLNVIKQMLAKAKETYVC